MTMFELVEASDLVSQAKLWVWNRRGIAGCFTTGGADMEPVIGLDVAKGASVFHAFMKRGEAYGKPEQIRHSEDGLERLGDGVSRSGSAKDDSGRGDK